MAFPFHATASYKNAKNKIQTNHKTKKKEQAEEKQQLYGYETEKQLKTIMCTEPPYKHRNHLHYGLENEREKPQLYCRKNNKENTYKNYKDKYK